MSAWLPALRMARRDLRRHKVRALLTAFLVGLPVFAATAAAITVHNDRWDAERQAHEDFFGADARIRVSGVSAIRPKPAVRGEMVPAGGAHERDPGAVDPATLLPEGSRLVSSPVFADVTLTTGGVVSVLSVDLASPMTRHLAEIAEGEAPIRSDEVAVSRAVASELGLLGDDGRLREEAVLPLVATEPVTVTGVLSDRGTRLEGPLLAPADTVLLPREQLRRGDFGYLVDLPELTRAELKELVGDLAAAGIVLQPADARIHPEAWGIDVPAEPVDLAPLMVGALCVLVGLIEVVLLVGAAFSVAARRQVRDLGLLAATGGARRDVRRVLLAQGLVLGVLSSLIGASAGVLAWRFLAGDAYRLLGRELWRTEINWPVIAVIALLGSCTSVIAALLPALRVGRLTPVEALSGRFPVRAGEARAHRGAFVLGGAGLTVLALGAYFINRILDRPTDDYLGAAVLIAAIGFVAMVVAAGWSAPYVVRRVGQLGSRLPLGGRYAFRDAARHRFRTAAAVTALMITVAGAVLAAFGISSSARADAVHAQLPTRTLSVDVWNGGGSEEFEAARQVVDRVVEPVAVAAMRQAVSRPGREHTVIAPNGWWPVQVVDEESLRHLTDADDRSLALFRAGGALTFASGLVRDGRIEVRTDARPKNRQVWSLDAVAVGRGELRVGAVPRQTIFVSADTAEGLGWETGPGSMFVRTAEPVTSELIDRLQVYGIYAWSNDPSQATYSRLRYAGLGGAAILTALVVGIAVALAAAESRDDVATLAAVGAGPWRRRGFGAMHGLFLGLVGCGLGMAVGVPAGMSFSQLDGLAGVDVPWTPLVGTVLVVLALSWAMGAAVTPSRFRLTRRVA